MFSPTSNLLLLPPLLPRPLFPLPPLSGAAPSLLAMLVVMGTLQQSHEFYNYI